MKTISIMIGILLCSQLYAIPPGAPKSIGNVSGKVLYAVWRGAHEVEEKRYVDDGEERVESVKIKRSDTWYVVLGGVKTISDDQKYIINLSLSLDSLFPQMPIMEKFPKGSVLLAFQGDSKVPISVGKFLKLSNVVFQFHEDATGTCWVDKIEVLDKEPVDAH